MKLVFILLATFLTILVLVVGNIHMQHFNQDSRITATQGIIFKRTLNLNEYKMCLQEMTCGEHIIDILVQTDTQRRSQFTATNTVKIRTNTGSFKARIK